MSAMRVYYQLTKPGIVYGNAFVAFAAFIFGSHGKIDWFLSAITIIGLSLIVASACVFNNYYDRSYDARMERTKARALAAGTISNGRALIFGALLGITGTLLLWLYANPLALIAALAGFVVYVFLYTPLKPRTGYALYVGAVAGAMPPVVGYAAATNTLNATALALFIFLALWQVPHFLAIARYRYAEYAAAGIPLLVREPQNNSERRRARLIFYASLAVLVLFCVALMLQR